jgi:SAM-dependent methyltransferase
MRQEDERQEDELAPGYDARWSEIDATHQAFVARFLSLLPSDGAVLDAGCGTGRFFPQVVASGRSLVGVDHAARALAIAQAKAPQARTARHDLQDLPYRDQFDGVMCVDAMEFVPPEEWPVVLARFRQALRPGGWLYLTVELTPVDQVRARNEELRRKGLPVVDGEVIWGDEDGYYHHYPTMDQVRAWIIAAGFFVEEEVEGPWHGEEYAYHHVLAKLT